MVKKIDDKKPKLKLVSNNKKEIKITKQKEQPITAKQSEFARLVAEEGKTASDAYRTVYDVSPNTLDKTIWSMASALMANHKVSMRIKDIHRTIEENKLTRTLRREEYVLKKLTEEVEQGDQASNRLKALHLLGQTVNMFSNKLEVETKTVDRDSQSIEQELKDKLQKLLGN
jgi:hypothetical protein|tara:strand:- start:1069 stop:1584 length:516 start_codon:yes stop_codon:yes gene_type:complete